MLIGEGAPVQVQGGGFARFFRAFSAAVLMDNEGFHTDDTWWNPDMKLRWHLQLASAFGRGVLDRLEIGSFSEWRSN
jgi:hypothetical protein